nr:acylphosphatase [Colletotrichum truncatum]KAF6792538.1 acylphosphatase [Colletotrichum truncatum]
MRDTNPTKVAKFIEALKSSELLLTSLHTPLNHQKVHQNTAKVEYKLWRKEYISLHTVVWYKVLDSGSYFAQKRATEYGLTGWCRNTDSNKVEGEAQGEEDALKKFLKDVDEGPRSAKVVKLDHEDRDLVDGEQDFLVRR